MGGRESSVAEYGEGGVSQVKAHWFPSVDSGRDNWPPHPPNTLKGVMVNGPNHLKDPMPSSTTDGRHLSKVLF